MELQPGEDVIKVTLIPYIKYKLNQIKIFTDEVNSPLKIKKAFILESLRFYYNNGKTTYENNTSKTKNKSIFLSRITNPQF